MSRYQKVKPIWILLKQDTVSVSGISWAICKVCTSLQTDNHASTPPLSFLQAGCPSCRLTNSVKALKATKREKLKSKKKLDKLRIIGKQSGESVESVSKKKRKATMGRIGRKGRF